ncbi:MAG: riboflavin synthase [Myxococcota bacterium]
MFSGIIQDLGTIDRADHRGAETHLAVRTRLAPDLRVGDSLAVDGVCLTVTRRGKRSVALTAVAETLAKTTLGALARGSRVNLEPALRLGDRVGGHLVQGHVEGVGRIRRMTKRGESVEVEIDAGPLLRYVVSTGSIAVDGVSLTVASVDRKGFRVALIPHTLSATTIGAKSVGDAVNLETDMLAKYVERMMGAQAAAAHPTGCSLNRRAGAAASS